MILFVIYADPKYDLTTGDGPWRRGASGDSLITWLTGSWRAMEVSTSEHFHQHEGIANSFQFFGPGITTVRILFVKPEAGM